MSQDQIVGRARAAHFRRDPWLAVSNDSAAQTSGGYWHHRKQQPPAAQALDADFQDRLIAKLAELTGLSLF
jgi:hypothetical protein